MNYDPKVLAEFLWQSNAIENEYSPLALIDAYGAWQYVFTAGWGPAWIGKGVLLRAHGILMGNLCPEIAGKIRTVSVSVGGRIPPKPEEIEWILNRLLLVDFTPTTEEEIKQWHISFEMLHPFRDGNGRIGRIIMNCQRIWNDLPILIIKESKREEYYKWFD